VYGRSKLHEPLTQQHGVTLQQTSILINTTVRISNLANYLKILFSYRISSTMAHSSTNGVEEVMIVDCESESGDHSSREAQSAPAVPRGTCCRSETEKHYTKLCKKELVVQLKRIDQNVRKLDVIAASKPTCQSLNYTLCEDIIVVSGDSDEEFPSSQVFDDK
jgi:hypothetical protein